jgi:protocatechuate 3,4-dioxygenase beta subunit
VKKNSKELICTQCYIKGDPNNDRDGILRGIRDAKQRESVLVDFAPIKESRAGEVAARFDIVLGFTPEEKS